MQILKPKPLMLTKPSREFYRKDLSVERPIVSGAIRHLSHQRKSTSGKAALDFGHEKVILIYLAVNLTVDVSKVTPDSAAIFSTFKTVYGVHMAKRKKTTSQANNLNTDL